MAHLAKSAATAKPTPFHMLLTALQSRGVLRRVYTQNIDALELKAGLTVRGKDPKCIQLHGSVMEVICTQCSLIEHIYYHFSTLNAGELPKCPQCIIRNQERSLQGKRTASTGGLLRPNIILYDETHSDSEHIATIQALDHARADTLLVVGTSLKTFGSMQLIKEFSKAVRFKRQGRAYYLDLESPPVGKLNIFDHEPLPFWITPISSLGGQEDAEGWVTAGRLRNDLRPSWDWV
jgi:NAD-dependent histone deacetylase SIR2